MRFARTDARQPRRAFTLIELLVVIAIIAILIALTGAAIFYWIGGQQRRNTEGTFRALNGVLQKQWATVIAEAKKEIITDPNIFDAPASRPNTLHTLSGRNAGLDPTWERTKVIWIKLRLREAFPMSYAEIISPSPYIPTNKRKNTDTYQKILKTTYNNGGQAGTQSAACLLMALSVNRGGSSINADQLGPAAFDTDGDGIPEIVDGWRIPIAFDRFGTSEPGLQAKNPAPAGSRAQRFADSVDSGGSLLNQQWYATGTNGVRGTYETHMAYPISPDTGSSANFVAPVLISAGPDNNLATFADNLYSYNLP